MILLSDRVTAGGGGTMLRRYLHGKDVDDPVIWYEGSSPAGNQRWLHTDHQGSVIAITDAAGNAIAVNSYDEYRIPKSSNIQYTGQAWLPELGMYYYKARISKSYRTEGGDVMSGEQI